MKAVIYEKYGGPEVLQIKDIKKPSPKSDELLIQVYTASLNPADWHYMQATLFILRFFKGFFKPKNQLLGADISGIVIALGTDVTQFKIGDNVFGRNLVGGYAEFACIKEKSTVTTPNNVSFKEAASIPLAALTALQGLQLHGNIAAGQKVLINGASGGIGTFAIQIAKTFQTKISGVCSTKNIELVKSLGADNVIDYTKDDFTKDQTQYDLILDIAGTLSAKQIKEMLVLGGTCVVIGFDTFKKMLSILFRSTKNSKLNKKNIKMMTTVNNSEDLTFIKELIESGKVKPVIDKEYPLNKVQDAFRYLGTKRAKGKIVLSINNSNSTTR